MKYFSGNSSEAKEWIENRKQFKPGDVMNLIFEGKTREDFGKFYGKLCDYIHPNVTGCMEYFKAIPAEDHSVLFIRNAPVYDSVHANDSLQILLYAIYIAMDSVLVTFKEQIETKQEMVGKLMKIESEILKIIPMPES